MTYLRSFAIRWKSYLISLCLSVFLGLGLTNCGLLFEPAWWQVYFTEPSTKSEAIAQTLVNYINNSTQSIHIAAFEFNLTPVAQALIAAKTRGVDVKWVTDDEYGLAEDKSPGHGQFGMLKKAKIPVKSDNRPDLMHNKFIIFDNQVVWTGSTNLTVNGTQKNNNNVIVLESPEVAAIFEQEFAEMWAGQFGPSSPSTATAQQVTVNGTPITILFAPEDRVAAQLIPLVEKAQNQLRFMAFSFTHEALGKAVLSRAKAGVNVQGIFETRGSETQYSELPKLYCAGVPVRQDSNPSAFHHKVFVIDQNILITGSFNFSNNANLRNDENVVILKNSEIARQYLQEFEKRWQEAKVPVKSKMKCQ
jgi:phosphatidylserine/phosphatidylglycerophosphate/cardiolipin synthase-like enzyme